MLVVGDKEPHELDTQGREIKEEVQEIGSEVCDSAGHGEKRSMISDPFLVRLPSLPILSLGVGVSLEDYFPSVGNGNRRAVSDKVAQQ